MFQGLKTALIRQKRLLAIFAVTIILPSITLSIFGIISLRNERFRLTQEIEDEQLQIADRTIDYFEFRFTETAERIENLTRYPAISEKDYPVIKELISGLSRDDSLAEITFLIYRNGDSYVPFLQPVSGINSSIPEVIESNSLQQQLKEAEDAEFIRHNYLEAVSIYHQTFMQSENSDMKARILNHMARNLMKAGDYTDAIDTYSSIVNDFPLTIMPSGVPLELYAQIQKTDCFSSIGDTVSAIKCDLNVLEELIENRWDLNESQFKTYASITIDRLNMFIRKAGKEPGGSVSRFESLVDRYHHQLDKWEMVNNLKTYVFPDLNEQLEQNPQSYLPLRSSWRIDNEDYLILATRIPQQNQEDNAGLLGVKLNNLYLRHTLLKSAVDEILPGQFTALNLTTLSGDTIAETHPFPSDAITTSVLFHENFPPWHLELAYIGPKKPGEAHIFSNFFFWTIVTLIVILVFGTFLVVRTVAHEMEILKIKSDFVSSVSHEFKTPLTSMKSLTERLQKGKVMPSAKLKQYISIIASDTDKLIRLVNNILNFSKIEEGKKVYHMEKTELALWLNEVIHNFQRESGEMNMEIGLRIDETTPALYIDRDAMRLALYNLLDNAIKFSGGNKKVEIEVKKVNDSILILLKDQGIGIDNDEKEKVFEKFFRGNSAVVHAIKGTGLGLAMVKHIVEAHKGEIHVKREPGWSTVMVLRFPITANK